MYYDRPGLNQPDLALWVGAVRFADPTPPGEFRLLIEELEYISADYAEQGQPPGRLIYAETFDIDAALVSE